MDRVTYAVAIKRFIERNSLPVSAAEMMAFWKACTPDERKQFAEQAAAQLGCEAVPA